MRSNIVFRLVRRGEPIPPYIRLQPGGFPRLGPVIRWISRAVLLGRTHHVVRVVGQMPSDPAPFFEKVRRAIVMGVIRSVVPSSHTLPLLAGHRVVVPGWAFPALDALGPEAQAARQRAFALWWGSIRSVFWDEGEVQERALSIAREAEEERLRNLQWDGGVRRRLTPEDYREARELASWVAQHALLQAYSRDLGEAPSLLSLEEAVLWAAKGQDHPRLPEVLRLLNLVGAEWPTSPVSFGGVSPLFYLFYLARIESRWGALAQRLGSWNQALLRRARALQRWVLENPGAPLAQGISLIFGESLEAMEEGRAVFEALFPMSLEEAILREDREEEDLPHYDPEEDLPPYDPERELQVRALREALEIEGVTAEEALEDPRLFARVRELTLALFER